MNTAILKSLLIMYENKRAKKMAEAEKRKEKLYAQNPRFSEIDNQLSTLSISASKNLISSSNFEYLDKLLTDWHDRNLKTSNDIQSFLKLFLLYLNYIHNQYSIFQCSLLHIVINDV